MGPCTDRRATCQYGAKRALPGPAPDLDGGLAGDGHDEDVERLEDGQDAPGVLALAPACALDDPPSAELSELCEAMGAVLEALGMRYAVGVDLDPVEEARGEVVADHAPVRVLPLDGVAELGEQRGGVFDTLGDLVGQLCGRRKAGRLGGPGDAEAARRGTRLIYV